ncbi:MAG: N-acetylmuramoyl-L-alanine amidase [Phascolarctobacterium sp.]
MRKLFLLALTVCMLLCAAVAQAAQITDVKWGVDKSNVLRLVVDMTDAAGYAVELASSDKLKLTVNAKVAAQVPKIKKIKSSLADELQLVVGDTFTEVHLPLKQHISASDYKAFVLKQDPKTGRPHRVVVDVTAAKTTAVVSTNTPGPKATTVPSKPAENVAVAGSGAAVAATTKPVVGSRPVKVNAAENQPLVTRPSTTTPVVSTQKPKSSQVVTAPTTAGVKVSTKNPAASDSKTVAASSGPKVIKIGSASKNDSKVSTKAGKNTKATKEEEPLAIKSKSKFRTGGGIKGKIITLDPGHGGSDPGAIGASGLKEKQITLEISMRVKELLEKAGAKVYMTRTTDVDVYGPNASDRAELQARVNVAEKNNSDLFLSLHINSSVNKSVGGFSSYYYPKTDNDLKIAKAIQDKFAKNFGVDNLGVRQANFYVVKRCSMPATLLEMCFISNPNEEKLMKGKWFQKKTARLIVEGVENYFK